jgi:transposase-like protein
MRKKGYKPEQIIGKLRKADVLSSQGLKVEEICRKLGVSDVTYYRWRKEYGGMQIEQAKRLKDLEKENSRLKNLVAELNLDKAILEEALKGNY